MKTAIFTLCVCLVMVLSSQGQTLSMAKQLGGPLDDVGYSIALDAAGNIYTTGFFKGTADFDPGPGTFNLTAAGLQDIFITKMDAAGNLVWAKQLGGAADDYGRSIAVDAAGYVYITGSFMGTADFDPGPGIVTLASVGSWDAFVGKLDASGNFVWAKSLGGSSEHDKGNSIAVDASGNVLVTGGFHGTIDFDPGPATFSLAAGYIDVFVWKLDASGSFVWAKKMGGQFSDIAYSIAVDGLGNVFTTGYFKGYADFDPGPAEFWLVYNSTDADVFISKLDPSGNFIWAKQFTASPYDYCFGHSIALDDASNVYIAGHFKGTTDFDPGPGTFNIKASALHDSFVSKLDAAGNLVWAKAFGGCIEGTAYSVALDKAKNVYVTGVFRYIADFDPGPGTFNLESKGGNDGYIIKLTSSGNLVWGKHVGGTWNYDNGYSIAVDAQNNVYTTGQFADVADFDPGAGTSNLTSAGGVDIYVHKLSQTAIVLPLRWLSFTVQKQGDKALLNWKTTDERNTKEFMVQHSTNGSVWTAIGVVAAAANSNAIKEYKYVHESPFNGMNYYRIGQKDKDSKSSYSDIRSLNFPTLSLPFVVLNNPVLDGTLKVQTNKTLKLSLYNPNGSLLWQKTLNAGIRNIDISSFTKGMYLLKSENLSKKVLVQ
jgi:hypothetical protein